MKKQNGREIEKDKTIYKLKSYKEGFRINQEKIIDVSPF